MPTFTITYPATTTSEVARPATMRVSRTYNRFSGPTASQWAALRACESGGDYGNKRNPAFRGAYQAAWSTWGAYGGYRDPADAPPAVQDQWARELYRLRGRQPWPVCGRFL